MNRLAPVFGILVLICLLAVLSKNINTGSGTDTDEKPPANAPPTKTIPLPADDPIPAETTLGNPATAKYHVQVGWVYDDTNQPDPAALQQALDAVKQWGTAHTDKYSVEIVNLDTPAEDLSPAARDVTQLGITVNGLVLTGENPGEGNFVPGQISLKLASATQKN